MDVHSLEKEASIIHPAIGSSCAPKIPHWYKEWANSQITGWTIFWPIPRACHLCTVPWSQILSNVPLSHLLIEMEMPVANAAFLSSCCHLQTKIPNKPNAQQVVLHTHDLLVRSCMYLICEDNYVAVLWRSLLCVSSWLWWKYIINTNKHPQPPKKNTSSTINKLGLKKDLRKKTLQPQSNQKTTEHKRTLETQQTNNKK